MSEQFYDVNNTLIQLIMVLKMQQLKQNDIPSLIYDDLEDYLKGFLWRKDQPSSLHEAANQILSVKAEDIIRYLSSQALTGGMNKDLQDFSDLLGGN